MIHALTILQSYFSTHPSTEGLEMSILSSTRQRMSLRIAKVTSRYVEFKYGPGMVTSRSDSLSMWLYPDDSLDSEGASTVVANARAWINDQPASQKVRPGYYKGFTARGVYLGIVASVSSEGTSTTSMTYDQLELALNAALHGMGEVFHRAVVFSARIKDSHGNSRGEMGLGQRASLSSSSLSVSASTAVF